MKGEDVETQSKLNAGALDEWCQKFFDKIISEESVNSMPRELRAICYFIESSGDHFKLDKDTITYPLISGFVMLRYLCPAITLPHLSGILQKLPDGDIRNNLTYIAKIVQKLANQEKFDMEAPHLMRLNDYVERNKEALVKYLKTLSQDPKQQEGKQPFEDLVGPVNYEILHTQSFNIDDLKLIHGLIFDNAFEFLVQLLGDYIQMPGQPVFQLLTDFYGLCSDLGLPDGKKGPESKNEKDSKETKEKEGESKVKKKETLEGKTQDEIESIMFTRALDFIIKNLNSFKFADFEQSKFIYAGKPAKDKSPVLYLILNRVEEKFFNSLDRLFAFVLKFLNPFIGSPYHIVIDMSFLKLNEEMISNIYRFTSLFIRVMSASTALPNCLSLSLVHPTASNLEHFDQITSLMDPQVKSKILKVIYDWTDLGDFIESANIWLPFSSKRFSPVSFPFTTGSKKDLLVKITGDSILNCDLKSGKVYSEILFSNIHEVGVKADTNEIFINYTPVKKSIFADPLDIVTIDKKLKNFDDGKLTYAYTENTPAFVEALVLNIINSNALHLHLSFKIDKEAGEKKTFPRILKLSSDSILNFSLDKVIRSEIPYSTIDSFYIDPLFKQRLFINFYQGGVKKSYVIQSRKVEPILEALQHSVAHYKRTIKSELDLYKNTKVNPLLEKFFSQDKIGIHKDFDSNLYKMYFNIDLFTKDFKDFSKKMAIDKNNKCTINKKKLKTYIESTKTRGEFKDEELDGIINIFDPKSSGYLFFGEMVSHWIGHYKSKIMFEKRQKLTKK